MKLEPSSSGEIACSQTDVQKSEIQTIFPSGERSLKAAISLVPNTLEHIAGMDLPLSGNGSLVEILQRVSE
jgi:hypothetical protein